MALEPRSLTHPPPSIWPREQELLVWCDDWQLAGANRTVTVGDDLAVIVVPISGAGLRGLFTGPVSAEPIRWALELFPAVLPDPAAATRLGGHVRALQAVTCVWRRTSGHQIEPAAGSGIKTPVSATSTRLPGWSGRMEPGSPGLLGFLITCTHAHLAS